MRRFILLPILPFLLTLCIQLATAESIFVVGQAEGKITSLKPRSGATNTEYVSSDRSLGHVHLKRRIGKGAWVPADTAITPPTIVTTNDQAYTAAYEFSGQPPLALETRFAVGEKDITWDIRVSNPGEQPVEIGDLALPLPMNSSFRRERAANSSVLKHSFVSGHGSFIFWMRPDSAPPFLLLTPSADTSLEYWETQSGGYRVYVHSAAAREVAREHGSTWRIPESTLVLAPRGRPGASKTYSFKFQFAQGYDDTRDLLVREGKLDVHVVPGMTVPADLFACFAIRSREPIHSVQPEFPAQTTVRKLPANGAYHLFKVKFSRLGENRLHVRYGSDQNCFLEFFSSEPVETLIKKRAAFIARSQHRDPAKWYNGLISEWNMESQVLLGPDNYDRIKGWRVYAVTCDDPGLSKPAFLAAKNAEYPAALEVEALDYYLKHFVWGGLQQTTEEAYPYGIYGIPDWKTNRESIDPGRNGRLHIWRVYDYPHLILLYRSMYTIAKQFPHLKTELPAAEYLKRGAGTALAMFTVPKKVEGWSADHTGFYNELVIVDLIRDLQEAGFTAEAAELRTHWERKVRYFVTGNPDLFGSEYPFDSTGFESTHALAKYALEYSAAGPGVVTMEQARRFMEIQMAANVFCRGWLEPAYYYLGSDYRARAGDGYTLSYMSPMGGWGVLDYALHFSSNPAPYLRLGYASFLSSWALMNTGTPESNYGFWYPGQKNDGAAGGGFEPAPFGQTWLGQPHHRGAWYYACETDLGYCGSLRAAATVLADDPIFGRFCFGGLFHESDKALEIVPRDGVRRRLHALLQGRRIHVSLQNDRFKSETPVRLSSDLRNCEFSIESDNSNPHPTRLQLAGLPEGTYVLRKNRKAVAQFELRNRSGAELDVPWTKAQDQFEIIPKH